MFLNNRITGKGKGRLLVWFASERHQEDKPSLHITSFHHYEITSRIHNLTLRRLSAMIVLQETAESYNPFWEYFIDQIAACK